MSAERTLQDEIHELNLTYLLLAQRMLKEDRATAMFRLKVDGEMADLLQSLSTAQLAKMARTSQLLFRPCLESASQLERMTGHSRGENLAQTHAAILLASCLPGGSLSHA